MTVKQGEGLPGAVDNLPTEGGPSDPPAATTAQAKPAEPSEPTVSLEQFNELKAQFEKVSAFADRVKDDEKKERKGRQTVQEQLDETLALLGAYKERTETLESAIQAVQPIVKEREAEVAQAKDAVAARMEGLPSYLQTALEGYWESDPKRALASILDYDAQAQTPTQTKDNAEGAPPPKQPPFSNSAPPPPGTQAAAVDFGALVAQGHKLSDLTQQYAEQFADLKAKVSQRSNPVESNSFVAGMFAGDAGRTKGK